MSKKKDPLIGITLGNYVIKRTIGKGAMGKVYLAAHPSIGKKIAIKVLASHLSTIESMSKRFMREAKTINKISHPNIIEIYDFGVLPDRRYYYTMEYVKGETLTAILKNNFLTIEQILEILREICDALEAVHEIGIIHRDLKPSNIMITKKRRRKGIKILDFGIAKLLEANATETALQTADGAVLGTPVYMSPEQAMGKSSEVTQLADIYAVGVILYKMISGTLPVPGGSIGEVLTNHLMKKPTPLKELIPEIPQSLSDVVAKCIEKNPEERYHNVYKFYEDVRDALKDVPKDTIFDPNAKEVDFLDSGLAVLDGSITDGSLSRGFINDPQPKKEEPVFQNIINLSDGTDEYYYKSESTLDGKKTKTDKQNNQASSNPKPAHSDEELIKTRNYRVTKKATKTDSFTTFPLLGAPQSRGFLVWIVAISVLLGMALVYIAVNLSPWSKETAPREDKTVLTKEPPTHKSMDVQKTTTSMHPMTGQIAMQPAEMKVVPKPAAPNLYTITIQSNVTEAKSSIAIGNKHLKTTTLPTTVRVKEGAEIKITVKKLGYQTRILSFKATKNTTEKVLLRRKPARTMRTNKGLIMRKKVMKKESMKINKIPVIL